MPVYTVLGTGENRTRLMTPARPLNLPTVPRMVPAWPTPAGLLSPPWHRDGVWKVANALRADTLAVPSLSPSPAPQTQSDD